jgi:hypothetical protein
MLEVVIIVINSLWHEFLEDCYFLHALTTLSLAITLIWLRLITLLSLKIRIILKIDFNVDSKQVLTREFLLFPCTHVLHLSCAVERVGSLAL